MKIFQNKPLLFVVGFFLVGAAIVGWRQFGSTGGGTKVGSVTVPEFSPLAATGRLAFDKNCAACHGVNAAGSDKGPPLVHNIYNPGHHGDGAIVMAAKRGVRSHHWNFGNMPPQPQATDEDLAAIIKYIRELQVANGIVYQQHRM